MHLSAAIDLRGVSGDVEDVLERIRSALREVDPDLTYLGIELKAVGDDFGIRETLADLLQRAERRRHSLLRMYWRNRQREALLAAQRLGHAMSRMNAAYLRVAISMTDDLLA